MQITIIQSEIETAITAYIRSLISVKEGMEIAIELKATRGDTGFQAFIDIHAVPGYVAKPVAEVAPAPVATPTKISSIPSWTPGQRAAVPAPVPVQQEVPAPIVGSEPTPEAVDEVVATPIPEAEVSVPEVVEPSQVSEPETAPAPARSLFKGLKRPSNG